MSEPASDIPAIPLNRLYQPEGAWGHVCHAIRVGWRPATGWVCVAILLVNGAVLPLARLWHVHTDPLDWKQMTPFAALLFGQGVARTAEKIMGASL
jgi:hypothetical protein